MGKEEIARNEQFLLCPQCFLLNRIIVSPSFHIFDIISLFATVLEEPKIGMSGKGLNRGLFGKGLEFEKEKMLIYNIFSLSYHVFYSPEMNHLRFIFPPILKETVSSSKFSSFAIRYMSYYINLPFFFFHQDSKMRDGQKNTGYSTPVTNPQDNFAQKWICYGCRLDRSW